jgi:pimeloyl-ACP methyl ester carboxylesterase
MTVARKAEMIKRMFKKILMLFIGLLVGAFGLFVAIMMYFYFTADDSTVQQVPQLTPTPVRTNPARTEELEIKPIEWLACDDKEVTEPGFECATLYVPLDYADPTGTQLEIAVIRYKAQSERKGSILYNPGGPGASGFSMVAWMGTYYVGELGLDEFDFVGFDPRGVERSNGLKCQTDAEIDTYLFGDSSPDTPEEEAFFEEANAAFVTACNEKYRNALQYYSTINTARDMDVIRTAMGDEQISYLGVSYGTYLGAVYASLFPDRVRAMVLDSAFEPNGDSVEEQYTTQLVGFERAMNNWIAWCESESTCAFRSDDVGVRWDALYEQYNQQPVTASDGRVTYQGAILRATKSALYAESSWGQLAQALADAEKGDVVGVWKLVDGYYERDEDGVYSSAVHAFDIISCASGFEYDDVPDPAALLTQMQQVAPRMSVDMTADDFESESGCEAIMPIQPTAPVGYTGDAPILVIGGENDPATPMRWSEKMRERMGPGAVLLKYTGEGHGQVLSAECVNTAAAGTLVSLTLPTDGTVCQPDTEVSEPSWWAANLPRAEQGEQFVSRDQLEADFGITKNDYYATGLIMIGTTEELMTRIHQRLELRGLLRVESPITLESNIQIADYFVEGESLRVMVLGSEVVTNGEWNYLQSIIPENHGIVFFLAAPK